MCPGGAEIDPRSPMCVPDLSGQLKEHWSDSCSECWGSGHNGPDPYPPEEACCHCKEARDGGYPECCTSCDPCSHCDGEGKVWFCSWYATDRGMCTTCGEEEVLCMACDDGDSYVCLPCYLAWHKEECSCDLWKEAESFILGD